MQQPRDFSLYGAVDLGARQSAAQRRQQAARNASSGAEGATPGPPSEFVIDATEETFNTEVALRSRTTPVVVELSAAWSEQGKQLGPALEKLAAEAGGAWVLARIDAEANPRLAQLFQAQSFPMVAAIIGGQVVAVIGGQMGDTFLDSISEAQVQEWIAQVMSVAAQLGLEVAPGQPAGDAGEDEDAEVLPPALAAARDAMEAGDLDGAAAALEKAIADGPPDPLAKSWLAQVNLMRRVSAADPAAASRAAAAHPEDVDAQLLVADFAMAGGDAEQAFDRVLGVIKRTSGAERNTARLRLLDLFEVLPPDDDRVKKARTQLTLLLF
jgi:putative thioredoxin